MNDQRRAYKTELDPNETQRAAFEQHGRAVRYVWNRALALREKLYRQDGLTIGPSTLNLLLTKWKQRDDATWLYEVSNSALQETFRELQAAYARFFETCAKLKAGDPATIKAKEEAEPRKDGKPFGFPRFRSKYHWSPSFTLRGGFIVEPTRIKLPKIGWVRLKERDYLPQDRLVKSATLSEQAGRWFVSILVEEDPTDLAGVNGQVLGVDLGLNAWAVASDGRRWERPGKLEALDRKLTHLQRKLARQEKCSGRWRETKAAIARLHWRVANARENALHEMTSAILGVKDLPATALGQLSLRTWPSRTCCRTIVSPRQLAMQLGRSAVGSCSTRRNGRARRSSWPTAFSPAVSFVPSVEHGNLCPWSYGFTTARSAAAR